LNYGASTARTLLASGEDVREVSPLLTHVERRRRSKGKSDPIDAVAIARVVAADETLPTAKRTALLFDLKLLVDYRDQLVRSRTQVVNRVHADLVVIRPGYQQMVPNLRARRHVIKARSLISRDRSVQGELVRRRLGEILRLETEIARSDRDIAGTLQETGTTLTQIESPGVLWRLQTLERMEPWQTGTRRPSGTRRRCVSGRWRWCSPRWSPPASATAT
jgi:transposase